MYTTQVVDESMLDYDLQARVDTFRESLNAIRAKRAAKVEEMVAVKKEIESMISSREMLLNDFMDEAHAMFPEIIVKDVFQLISELPKDHMLVQLWGKYEGMVSGVNQKIDALVNRFNTLLSEESELSSQEKHHLSLYAQFAQGFIGRVPDVEQMQSELRVIEMIPQVDEGTLMATKANVTAFDMLSPEASEMVTAQAVDDLIGYDREQVNAELMQTMVPSEMHTMAENKSFLPEEIAGVKLKPWHYVVGGLALLYIIGG